MLLRKHINKSILHVCTVCMYYAAAPVFIYGYNSVIKYFDVMKMLLR